MLGKMQFQHGAKHTGKCVACSMGDWLMLNFGLQPRQIRVATPLEVAKESAVA